MTDQGVITERFITVKDFNDHYIRAYRHFRKTFRTFKRSKTKNGGIIMAVPVTEQDKELAINFIEKVLLNISKEKNI